MVHLLALSEIPYSRECSSGDRLSSSFPQGTHTDLPSSLRFLGPYLSMMMPRGRVMALSRKEPTVNAKFRISSWALQLSQPFTRLTSSCSGSAVLPTVPLVTFSVYKEGGYGRHLRRPKRQMILQNFATKKAKAHSESLKAPATDKTWLCCPDPCSKNAGVYICRITRAVKESKKKKPHKVLSTTSRASCVP